MQYRRVAVCLACAAGSATAQWDPASGDWLKSDPTDLRVMTWNVQDAICSSNTRKTDVFNDWNALVRIVAGLQPDVLILQEAGDNSGNGTGSGVDSVANLTTTLELFIRGGTDPFNGGAPVTSFVQLFAPGYDLAHIFVSGATDGFNRNVILSRHPFADINGDGIFQQTTFVLAPDAYQGGGSAGIRGFTYAEIDLPDDVYAGDMVIGNSHLKAGGSSDDFDQRRVAAQNIAYFLDYFYNGAGGPTADPNGKILVPPTTPPTLGDDDVVVWGGDWNQRVGGKGPAEWMTEAQLRGGTDGTDRDRSDSVYDRAVHPITGDTSTQSSSKIDFLAWQDSIADARRAFIFRSSGSGMTVANQPEPVRTYPVSPLSASGLASDHRPVIVDLVLPLAEPACPIDFNDDGLLDFFDVSAFLQLFNAQDPAADLNDDGLLDFFDVSAFLQLFGAGCP